MEVIINNIWSIIAILIAVIIPVSIYFAQRKKKKLSYEIVSNTQLLSVQEEMQGKIKILYEDEEVDNVHLLTIKLINNGNQPINSNDFEGNINITVNNDAKILTHSISEKYPNNLNTDTSLQNETIRIPPLLLNSKDCFIVKALISDLKSKPTVHGRISGVKSITESTDGKVSFVIFSLISFSLITYGAINLESKELHSFFGFTVKNEIIGVISFILGYFSLVTVMLKNKRFRQILKEMKYGLRKALNNK